MATLMPSNEATRPGYVPAIGGASSSGAILFSATQSLTLSQKSVARSNMGLGSAATVNMGPVAGIAAAGELVRGDDLRFGYIASKADLVSGKLASSQLPDHAVTVAVAVANQAARLALSASAASGRIFRDDDTKISYCLIAGGVPSNPAHWLSVGDAVVTLNDITGITSLGISLCGAANPAVARAAMALANVADASGLSVAMQGDLILGNASSNKLTISVASMAGPMTVNSSYRAGGATLYWALTTNSDGTLALADIVGLSAAMNAKADLVGGKVPLSQLPTIVGSLTSSIAKADATARLAMTPTEAAGILVVQADDKSSWMLKAGGTPSNPLDWLQVGDAEVRVAEIVDAGVTGQELMLCGTATEARSALGVAEDDAVTFASVYLASGNLFFTMSAGVHKFLSKPTTMTGSGWTLPNRSGYLAYSPNADGSLTGANIAGGNPVFTTVTTGSLTLTGAFTHNIGASERWLSGIYVLTQTVNTLTANRNHAYPNGSGTYALVASSTGAINISDVASLTTALGNKADLVSGKVPSSQLPATTLTNFSNGVGSDGRVAGSLTINAGGAETFTIDCSSMIGPVVVYPPSQDGELATVQRTIRASGLNAGRGITTMGVNTILASDMGTKLEVHLGITAVNFPTYAVIGSNALPGCLDLWVRPTSVTLSGSAVYDRNGTVITSLPQGLWHVVLLLEGLSTARYVVENYVLNPLRDAVSEITPTGYTPDAGWRAGGNADELGAHLKGIDASLFGQRGFLSIRHAAQQMLLNGDNVINLNAAGGTVEAIQNCSLVSNTFFAPSVDGTWMLHLSFWLVYDPEDADMSGSPLYTADSLALVLRMQTLGTAGWTDYGNEFPVLVDQAKWSTTSVGGGGGSGGPSYQIGYRYEVRAVVPFFVSGAGIRRQLRFVLPGKSPSGVLYIGHPTTAGGDDPYFPGATALQFQAHQL